MNNVKFLKKFLLIFCLLSLFNSNIRALQPNQLTIPKDFSVYNEDQKAVAEALNMTVEALEKELNDSGTVLLAVNKDNSQQIRLTVSETDFSDAVGNFATMSDNTIKSLLPDITGYPNVQGKIVTDKNGEKFVEIALQNKNEDYLLTQYFTVSDHKIYTLSFYTNNGESTDYIEKTFATFETKTENNTVTDTSASKLKLIQIAVICATVIFGAIFFVLLYTIIKDFVRRKKINETDKD